MTRQYLTAAQHILDAGTRKTSRTGLDTFSAFAVPMQFDLRAGFPLLTTKAINWWHIVAENLWFLSGRPNIEFLKKHKIRFWDAWADENNNVPSAYGNFWRKFPVHPTDGEHPDELHTNDQIKWLLDTLKRDPYSRRLVVSAWAPGNAQTSKLPPCHTMFVLNTQNLADAEPHLCLHLTQRSADMFLGVPYNIAGYAFLLSLFAHLSGMEPGIFAHTLVDAHFYTAKLDGTLASGGTHGADDDELLDHVPLIEAQLKRKPRALPTLTIDPSIKTLDDVTKLLDAPKDEILDIFRLTNYNPHPTIKGKAAV